MYAFSKEINGHLKTGDSDDESERPQLFADSVPPSAEDNLKHAEKQTQRAYTSRPDVDDDGKHPHGFFPGAYDGSHLGAGPVKVKDHADTDILAPKEPRELVARLPASTEEEDQEESVLVKAVCLSDESPVVEGAAPTTASAPSTRCAEPMAPGAVLVGGIDDEESELPQEDPEQPTLNESDQMQLISATLVDEPIIVSASQLKCICCPYGRLTALPAVVGGIGSFFCMMAAFFGCLATYEYTSVSGYSYTSCAWDFVSVIIGLASGSLGGIAFVLSTVMSCATFSKTFLKILGGTYILLAITSLLTLVGLASGECISNGGCTLAGGGIMSIVASLMFFGAGISTFFLKSKMQTSQPTRTPST